MAEKKVFEGTNIGQVNISVKVRANNLKEATEMLDEIIDDQLPDLSTVLARTGVEIYYAFDETFEETEVREIEK